MSEDSTGTESREGHIPDNVVIEVNDDDEDAHETIGKKNAKKLIELVEEWSADNPFVVHAETIQGAGKTVGGMESMAYHAGPTAIFGPRHDDVQEDTDMKPFEDVFEIHFEGKDRVCEHDDYQGKHKNVISSISSSWCEGCKHRSSCDYIESYRRIQGGGKNFSGVHQHLLYFPTVLDVWEGLGSVLIDESPWDTIVEQQETFTEHEIEESQRAVNKLVNDDDTNIDATKLEAIDQALSQSKTAITEDQNPSGKTFEYWKRAYEKCDEDNDIGTITHQLSKIHADRQVSDHTEVVRKIFKAMPHIQEVWEEAVEEDRHLPTESPFDSLWRVNTAGLQLRWIRVDMLRDIARNKPVCVLATEMETEVVRTIFDLPVVTISDDYAPPVDVCQLASYTAGVTVLKEKQQAWDNLLELTELAIQRETNEGNKTFVATKDKLEDDVREYLTEQGFTEGEEFMIGHYFGLTGSNNFEDCDAVVLFGNARLREEDARAKGLMTGIDRDVFQNVKSEGELRDALHRTRATRKNGVRAYILTDSVDYENDFSGEYNRLSVTDFRRRLEQKVSKQQEAEKIQSNIIEFVEKQSSAPTSTDFKQLNHSYSKVKKHREKLVEQGQLSIDKESEGNGPPTNTYRISEP